MRTQPNKNLQKPKIGSEDLIIHNVMISDASGSMQGSKYRASVESIKAELAVLARTENAKFTQTLIEFDSGRNFIHFWMNPNNPTNFSPIGASGGTPLYMTIGTTLTALEREVKQGEKVLIKIFTDGEDTLYDTGEWNSKTLPPYIQKLINVNGWTITFNCTVQDKSRITRIGIPESNILTHENTAESIQKVSSLRTVATMDYLTKSLAGEDVVSNFYSKSVE